MNHFIEGFSKKSQKEKIELIAGFLNCPEEGIETLQSFSHPNKEIQEVINEFSENVVSNFHLPYSIAPNFLIDGEVISIPMVIEESSVVAAASKSAKFWYKHGGFHTEILGVDKVGQVHFLWKEEKSKLNFYWEELKLQLLESVDDITRNMRKRGGGIKDIILKDLSDSMPDLMQLFVVFDTVDSMGANFINSCLERFSETIKEWYQEKTDFKDDGLEIIMSILSNLTPNCMVKCWVETEISKLDEIIDGVSGQEFAEKFQKAVQIAQVDPYRATTHNKGIYNGVDAVVLATGNDFRAVEACGHAYAGLNGTSYRSLTTCIIDNNIFRFELNLPISLGVVGGLTQLHPLVKLSHEILNYPNAQKLMGIAAVAGLANNFAAVKSLTTTGIQKGHMKMHLFNIMNQLNVRKEDRNKIIQYFADKTVSVAGVRDFVESFQLT